MKKLIALLLLLGTFSTTCWCSTSHVVSGAEQTHLYFPLLKGKKIVLFPTTPAWWAISTCWISWSTTE